MLALSYSLGCQNCKTVFSALSRNDSNLDYLSLTHPTTYSFRTVQKICIVFQLTSFVRKDMELDTGRENNVGIRLHQVTMLQCHLGNAKSVAAWICHQNCTERSCLPSHLSQWEMGRLHLLEELCHSLQAQVGTLIWHMSDIFRFSVSC